MEGSGAVVTSMCGAWFHRGLGREAWAIEARSLLGGGPWAEGDALPDSPLRSFHLQDRALLESI